MTREWKRSWRLLILLSGIAILGEGCSSRKVHSLSSPPAAPSTTVTEPRATSPTLPSETSGRPRTTSSASSAIQEADPIVLEVNGIQVRRLEYEGGLREFLRQQGESVPTQELAMSYRRQLVNELLLYDYGRRIGVDREAEYQRRLELLNRQLMIEYVQRTRIQSRIRVTSEEIQRYYNEHPNEFGTPRMIQVRAIQTQNAQQAEEVLRQLKEDPSRFAELARRYSIHPSKDRGGDLDPFPRGTYAAVFEEAAFKLNVGEISPILTTQQGFYILEKTGEISEQYQSLPEVQASIAERLRNMKESQVREDFLKTLRAEAAINPPLPPPPPSFPPNSPSHTPSPLPPPSTATPSPSPTFPSSTTYPSPPSPSSTLSSPTLQYSSPSEALPSPTPPTSPLKGR